MASRNVRLIHGMSRSSPWF